MSKILSRILRRQLDSVLEALEFDSDFGLTFAQRDTLEKRFFELHEFMESFTAMHFHPVSLNPVADALHNQTQLSQGESQ